MKVYSTPVGPIQTNCYFLIDESTLECAIIDPGEEAYRLWSIVEKEGLQVRYLLLTHGHYDHTGAVAELLSKAPDAKVYIHSSDYEGDPSLFPLRSQISQVDFLSEGDSLPLGSETISVLHTPGHSLGSLCFLCGENLFAGDTLFAGSCGRTDLSGGDMTSMLHSLSRLYHLDGDYHVFPGHMDDTTLAQERDTNPYMAYALRQNG